jgi:hypothetical protein
MSLHLRSNPGADLATGFHKCRVTEVDGNEDPSSYNPSQGIGWQPGTADGVSHRVVSYPKNSKNTNKTAKSPIVRMNSSTSTMMSNKTRKEKNPLYRGSLYLVLKYRGTPKRPTSLLATTPVPNRALST